jgi:DNA repair exonuclease SbcCD ATPase subunit
MASSSDALDYPIPSTKGIRIRSKDDLDRVIAQVRKKEAELKSVQNRLKAREVRLAEAQQKLAKRNEFLDAWEVSLKSKESEMMEEREEIEEMKQNLRELGQQILALSDKTSAVFEGLPYEDDIFEDFSEDEAPADKKPILGFLKSKPKKGNKEPTKRKARGKKKPSGTTKSAPARKGKTLRDTLKEKRDRLKSTGLDDLDELDDLDDTPEDTSGLKELEDLLQDEAFTCPSCEGEVSSDDDTCPECGVELNWGA